jgi:hypothetical protein
MHFDRETNLFSCFEFHFCKVNLPQLLQRNGDLDAVRRLRRVERDVRVLRSHFN